MDRRVVVETAAKTEIAVPFVGLGLAIGIGTAGAPWIGRHLLKLILAPTA